MISATPRRRPSKRALCAVAGGSVHLRAKMRVRNRFWHELFSRGERAPHGPHRAAALESTRYAQRRARRPQGAGSGSGSGSAARAPIAAHWHAIAHHCTPFAPQVRRVCTDNDETPHR
jgi:hypothetical protein